MGNARLSLDKLIKSMDDSFDGRKKYVHMSSIITNNKDFKNVIVKFRNRHRVVFECIRSLGCETIETMC